MSIFASCFRGHTPGNDAEQLSVRTLLPHRHVCGFFGGGRVTPAWSRLARRHVWCLGAASLALLSCGRLDNPRESSGSEDTVVSGTSAGAASDRSLWARAVRTDTSPTQYRCEITLLDPDPARPADAIGIDLGTVHIRTAHAVPLELTVVNGSSGAVELARAASTCGCALPDAGPRLAPGESHLMTVHLRAGAAGPISATLLLPSDSGRVHRVAMSGLIVPQSVLKVTGVEFTRGSGAEFVEPTTITLSLAILVAHHDPDVTPPAPAVRSLGSMARHASPSVRTWRRIEPRVEPHRPSHRNGTDVGPAFWATSIQLSEIPIADLTGIVEVVVEGSGADRIRIDREYILSHFRKDS